MFILQFYNKEKKLKDDIEETLSKQGITPDLTQTITKKVMDFIKEIQDQAGKLNIDLKNIITS